MALIEVLDEDDGRLEAMAPDYLKGSRMTARRIRWAIETLCKLLARKGDSRTGSSPTSAADEGAV